MPEINYKALREYYKKLKEASETASLPVYLIYGEEMLVKSVYDELLGAMIPDVSRSLNFEPFDGTHENIREVIERMNTFSLLPGIKVIAVQDSKIFYSGQDKGRLLENAENAYHNNELKKAAAYLIDLLGHLNLTYDDVAKSKRGKALGLDVERSQNDSWLDDLIVYCREQKLSIKAPEDDCSLLQAAVEKGFPKNNILIITAGFVDKRRSLFKTIKQKGMIIDCSVPKGDRRADKVIQEDILMEKMSSILDPAKKKMDQAAYLAMYEMTGFDLRTFSSNLEKLIHYIGDRDIITIEDVASVLKRTKKDPLYDLTNALADRNVEQTLFYLDSILSADFHPLQVLAALTNQVRRLLIVKDFVESPRGSRWHAGCSYNHFQNRIMPEIVAYDLDLMNQIEDWENMLSNTGNDDDQKPAKKGKKKIETDLTIAKNPKNPYPVYLLLKKSERYTKAELSGALEMLHEADSQLKSTGQNPRLILEKAIFGICQPQRRA